MKISLIKYLFKLLLANDDTWDLHFEPNNVLRFVDEWIFGYVLFIKLILTIFKQTKAFKAFESFNKRYYTMLEVIG